MGKREGRSGCRFLLALPALLLTLSCQSEATPLHPGTTAQRLTPRWVEAASGGGLAAEGLAAWALFDRDTATAWTPSGAGEPVAVTLAFDDAVHLDTLKTFGPSAYELTVLDASGQVVSGPHDLETVEPGWTRWSLPAPAMVDGLTLRFSPTGESSDPISEVELWGLGGSLPSAWEPVAGPEDVPLALADVIAAREERIALEPGIHACSSASIVLTRHPGVYRRAWLRYRATGAFRPWVLTRALNEGAMVRGRWVPSASPTEATFVSPIDPEQLRLGVNEAHFCLPGEADAGVEIAELELVAELDHGSNVVESITLAAHDAIPTAGANALLTGTSEPATIAADQEIVIAFERWIAPSELELAGGGSVEWSFRCVTPRGAMEPIEAARAEDRPELFALSPDPRRGCAGLRARPSGEVALTSLRVQGSGTDRRIDSPRIVLASAREHFGQHAWVDGWVRAPSDIGGRALVRLDDRLADTDSGVFGELVTRTADAASAWAITVGGRFVDGSSASRVFVLEEDAGALPGGLGLDDTIDDGLTPEERRVRFGEVDQRVERDVGPGEAAHIELGTDVSVDLPAGALRGRTTISITHLGPSRVPPLDPGLVNVTAPFAHGYEMLPHGQQFEEPATITLPYQPSLLPPGYVPQDVQTFYYDTDEQRWEPLARTVVERDRQVVESLTDHFTVMINAIVVAPEHPQVASFDPNRMQGIEPPTPSAGIVTIAPPEPNSRGDAALSYPLEIPAGRAGVQPSFALSYSSARGNGLLGVGWDLPVSSIEIDTRWGVPRYDASFETETYVLDGEQLAPTAHRDTTARPRSADGTIFRPRVERSHSRIIRHGRNPREYYWEVIDRSGVRSFYGGTAAGQDLGACLTDALDADGDPTGNVFRWALREVRDPHGNVIRFRYDRVVWAEAEQVPGWDLHLASAHYTLGAGEDDSDSAYQVRLVRSPRPDLIVSGRGGFKQVTSERVQRVEVYFRETLVRAWNLSYDLGPFGKSRLRGIEQRGVGDVAFPGNVHTFDYYDEVSTGVAARYQGFTASSATWSAGDEAPQTGTLLPEEIAGHGQPTTSVLGGTRSDFFGTHFYGGFNINSPTKPNSYGVRVGSRFNETHGLVALVDVDGDALADRVYRGDEGFYYNRNLFAAGTAGFDPEPRALGNASGGLLQRISHETAGTFSIGVEGYPGLGSFHANAGFTLTQQGTYFSDVNADGFVDLVSDGTVLFNRPDAAGLPLFAADNGLGTPVPIGASAIDGAILPGSFDAPAGEDTEPVLGLTVGEASAPIDTIRRWQAPYPGRVRISGDVRLVAAQTAHGADGVRASIDHEGATLWTHTFGPTETAVRRPSLEIDLDAGDRLYFRVHSLRDGQGDQLSWSPRIDYLDLPAGRDANGLDVRRFDAAADFALAGRAGAGFTAPFDGVLRIEGTLRKLRETTDDVVVELRNNGVLVWHGRLESSVTDTLVLDRSVTVQRDDFITLRTHTDSPIDLSALRFDRRARPDGVERDGPWVHYTSATDTAGEAVAVRDHHGRFLFEVPVPIDLTSYPRRDQAIVAPSFIPMATETLNVVFLVNAALPVGDQPSPRGDRPLYVTFTAKSRGRLLASRRLFVTPGSSASDSFEVDVTEDEPVFFSFTASDPALFDLVTAAAGYAGGAALLPTIIDGPAFATRLPGAYRGWSTVGYDASGTRGSSPIDPAVLEAALSTDLRDATEPTDTDGAVDLAGEYADTEDVVLPLHPLADSPPCRRGDNEPEDSAERESVGCNSVRGGHWLGADPFVYVTATEVSSSLMGSDRPAPLPEDFAGAQAVPRITVSTNVSTGGGVGIGPIGASGSIATGFGHGQLDYFDLNGDSYPDVVTAQGVQYTTAVGVLGRGEPLAHAAGDVHHTNTVSGQLGLNGSSSEAQFGSRGEAGTASGRAGKGTAGSTQMPTFGLSLGLGGGHAVTTLDYQDVNGDGLPDRVQNSEDGTLRVALNLGYRFADWESWGTSSIHEGWSHDFDGGVSLSFNSGEYAYGGGVNAGYNESAIDTMGLSEVFGGNAGGTLLDINGDGLLDRVSPRQAGEAAATDGFWVWFNLGHHFASTPVLWRGRIRELDVQQTRSTSVSTGGYFTFGIGPLCYVTGTCYIAFNLGGDGGQSVSSPVVAVRDIDGDGQPDHLVSTGPGSVEVAHNNTGRTDLLRQVHRPLGATITLDYARSGNTPENPQHRFVLSSVKVFDGQEDAVAGEASNDHLLRRIAYEGGRYDRFERDFYGFARVVVDDVDTRGWDGGDSGDALLTYRRSELAFHNDLYARRGLMRETRVLDGGGRTFGRSVQTWQLRDAERNEPVSDEDAARTASVFPALVRVERFAHEGEEDRFIQSVTTQDYDRFGNVTRYVDAGGAGSDDDYVATIAYSGDDAACAANHIVGVATDIRVTDLAGRDLRRRAASVDCASGDMTQVRTALSDSDEAVTDLGYDSDGNLTSLTQPPNRAGQRYSLSFAYDPDVRTHVVSVSDSFGYVSSTAHDLRFGVPTRETDLNGAVVETEYDAFGRVSQVTGPLEREADFTVRFGYTTTAPVPYARTEQIDVARGIEDPIETLTFQDGLGRTLQVKRDATVHSGDDTPSSDVMLVSGRTHYDPWGRVEAVWHPTHEAKVAGGNEAFIATADPSAEPTRMTYDVLDRVVTTELPDASMTRQAFSLVSAVGGSGLWAHTRITDAEGHARDAVRDARGRIRAVVEHNESREIVTRYDYDPLDQIVLVTDADGNRTTVGYDLAGRRTDITHPDSGHTSLRYDRAGNLIRRTTPNLRSMGGIEYHYDQTHLVRTDYPSDDTADVTYTWGDAALRGSPGFRVGRITRVEDGSGSEERSYDALGQVVTEVRTVASPRGGDGSTTAPQVFTTRYAYDTWGRLQQVVYPDTEVLTYRYDSGGRVRQAFGIKVGQRFDYVARLEYDRFGQRAFQETGNGIRTHFTYDAATRRLEELEASDFQRLDYGYDRVGNITSLINASTPERTDRFGGRVEQTFGYDDLNRLTTATGSWTNPRGRREEYTYGLAYSDIHNITHKAQEHTARSRMSGHPVVQHRTSYEQAYDYAASRPHAPTQVGEREMGYDDNGNLVSVRQPRSGLRRTLVWDDDDRVSSISDNGRTTTFVYDHGGQRRIKLGAQGETVYANQFWTVRNGRVGTKHVYVGSTRIASKLSPGEAHLSPDPGDLVTVMLGRWFEHRSDRGHERARNLEMNPHYRVPSTLPLMGTPETNFVYFYHPDHLGSTQYVTDADGELYEHVQYFPSGETWVEQSSNAERLPHLFTGQELDQETGLYYFGARYYEPRVGLWIRAEPALNGQYLNGAGIGGGIFNPVHLSAYCYATSNPLTVVDPDGELALFVGVVAATLLAAAIYPTSAAAPADSRDIRVNRRSQGASYAHMVVAGVTAAASVAGGFVAGVASVAIDDIDRGEVSPGSDYVVAGMLGAASAAGSTLLREALRVGRPGIVQAGRELLADEGGILGRGARRAALPTLDATGKMHGPLPRVQDLSRYTTDELTGLRADLRQSVQARIRATAQHGSHRPHGQRQGAEQALIRSIDRLIEHAE